MRTSIRLLPLLLLAAPALAQTPIEPAKLPANTAFYVVWRGMNSQAGAKQANSLLALWNDPDFAAFRAALIHEMAKDRSNRPNKKGIEPAELQEFSALLENPFVFGVISEPKVKTVAASAKAEAATKWDGAFFVYDASGKEALYQKLLSRLREGDEEKPEITRFTVGSVQAERVVRKSHTHHYALAGRFAVSAADRGVFEEILRRVAGTPTSSGLGETSAFREAQQELQPGSTLELFLKIPDLRDFAPSGSTQQAQFSALLEGLHLDALHSVCASLRLEGSATRIHGAILGDTRPGTPFDLWAAGDAPFASLALAPAGTVSYTVGQIDLPGFYDTLRKALKTRQPAGQDGFVELMEGMLASRLGMPLPEALRLLTGEFGSFSTSNDFNPEANIFALGIAQKPETLKLLRTMLSDRISSERNEGSTTFLKISLSSQRTSAGLAQWKFYHLAVTPNLILGATNRDTLRSLLAAPHGSGGLASDAHFLQARARFPETINGISYYDFTGVDWAAARDFWIGKLRESAKKPDDAARVELLRLLNWEVFSRHLHTAAGASWKDARGLRFDEWIE
jgi:hypothetical protein